MNPITRKDLAARCQALQQRLMQELSAIADEGVRRDYASILLVRLLFATFMERQGLLDGDNRYLQHRLARCRDEGVAFSAFLATLTYSGFCTPRDERPAFVQRQLGAVPYLSGSLFRTHPVERWQEGGGAWAAPPISARVVEEALVVFEPFAWTLEEEGDSKGAEGAITPFFLGVVAEQQVEERKKTGSYYTPVEICDYIVRQTCEPIVLQRFEELTGRHHDSIEHLLDCLDARDCALLLFVVLPSIAVLDPACGAGEFLVVALYKLSGIYGQVTDRARGLHHPVLDGWLQDLDESHSDRAFALKRRVLSSNLFGVDIQHAPLEITRMRLCLHLLSRFRAAAEVEALPNLDYAFPRGNSLVGITRIAEKERAVLTRLYPRYDDLVARKNELVPRYREAVGNPTRLAMLRAEIDACRRAAYTCLNHVLALQLAENGAKVEERVSGGQNGRARAHKRPFTRDDIDGLDPLHWAYDFDGIMHGSWWARLDGTEAEVLEVGERLQVRFGPERIRSKV